MPASGPTRLNVDGLGRLPAFCHATVVGDTIHVSGTLGTVGASFELAPGGVGPQTTQIVANIERILAAADATLADLVKVNVYLVDMDDFAAMNEAYEAAIADPPARITVGVAALALGAAVEMDAVAHRPAASA